MAEVITAVVIVIRTINIAMAAPITVVGVTVGEFIEVARSQEVALLSAGELRFVDGARMLPIVVGNK